jgi:cobalt-zinc-cadmium efflux system membrane fusion protein
MGLGAFYPRSFAPGVVEAAPATPAKPSDELRYAPDAPEMNAIRIVTTENVPQPSGVPANGRLTYNEDVTARVSSPIAGRVMKMAAQIGDRIGKDGVLAEIDSPDLASAQADMTKASADQTHKKTALDRARELADSQTGSRKDLESAAADYAQAVAETARAGQRLRNLASHDQAVAGRYVLRSPVAGVVVDRQINPGMEIRPDLANPLFTVTDPSRLWIIADVPEASLSGIRNGQAVEIEVEAWPGQRFKGTVKLIGATLDPGSRRVQVRCEIANPDGKLKAEMFARVAFLTGGNATAVRVPNTSLVLNGVENFVIVEREPGVFVKRKVHVSVNGLNTSYVSEGLRGGERIVSEGALLLATEFPNRAD